MASKDITERIESFDPDKVNWSDPNAYAAMGVGEDDPGENDTPANEGDTAGAAPAPAAAATPAPAAPAVAAAPASAPADGSATPSAAAESNANDDTQRPAGVATRDGKHVIPYEVLANTRDHARRLETELAEARQQLEQLAKAGGKSGAAPDADLQERAQQGLLTEDERIDFPALAKIEQAFVQLNERLSRAAAAPAASPAPMAPSAAPAPAAPRLSDDEEFDLAIAQSPLIAQWMQTKGPEWRRAAALDKMLRDEDPNLGYLERFARVQRAVAAEFGVELPASTPAPRTKQPAAAPAPQVRDAAMPSLSDFGGSPPQSQEDAINSATTTDLLAQVERYSDAELARFAGIGY